MGAYLVRRLATLPLLLLGISAASFALLNLAPGDPAEIVLRQRNPAQLPSQAEVSAMRIELGLDAPLPVQYVRWVSQALAGDMGRSYVTEQPVAAQLARRTVPTALLTAAALALALLVAVPVGILSAQRRGSPVDTLARLMALVGAAAPSYALAYGLIILFAVKLSWLPALGYGSAAQVVLPAFALSLAPMAQLMRLIRASMLETLGQDYIRTARAKGLSEQTVAFRHASPQRDAAGHRGHRGQPRLSAQRRRHRGDHLHLARFGSADGGGGADPGLPRGAGVRCLHRRGGAAGQSGRGHRPARRRPAPALRSGRDVAADVGHAQDVGEHVPVRAVAGGFAQQASMDRAAAGAGNRAGAVPGRVVAAGWHAGALASPG